MGWWRGGVGTGLTQTHAFNVYHIFPVWSRYSHLHADIIAFQNTQHDRWILLFAQRDNN